MRDALVSVVLPVHNQGDHIRDIVEEHLRALARIGHPFEVVLVPNGCRDDSVAACQALATAHPEVRVVESAPGGWGRAVRTGLGAARGDLLCYTNSARTTPEELTLLVLYATVHPGTVVKANRKIRERWTRRLGSLLYNLECRALFDLSSWDVNGTPKVFPRSCDQLLRLTRNDDLIDAEFNWICRRAGYPMLEVPIFSHRRHGGTSTTSLRSAARMYWGAWQMARMEPS
jgi:undecaprenyl-phosphate 4-deoxy-4-formamido-L-arabinose transferase